MTGEGLADLVVHALLEEHGTDVGTLWLVPGGALSADAAASAAALRFVDGSPGLGSDYFIGPVYGSILGLEDLTGDGLPELALSSGTEHEGGPFAPADGAVYVLASPLPATPGVTIPLAPSYALISALGAQAFGSAMAAGDLDADGVQDLVVSANEAQDLDGKFRGSVYVFAGPLAPGEYHEDAARNWVHAVGNDPYLDGGPGAMGTQLIATDLTGDGIADLVVTASSAAVTPQQLSTGEVYYLEGPLFGDPVVQDASGTLQGDPSVDGDNFGGIANAIGDTDGDGLPEIAFSGTGGRLSLRGNTFIVNGPVVGRVAALDRADTRFTGLADYDQAAFGAPAGDLDLDGTDDLAVSAIAVNGDTRGAVFLYYGPIPTGVVPIDVSPGATLWGDGGWPIAVAAGGDLNGDCAPDLAVGSRFSDSVSILAGGSL
ncbi:MAG: FG-GAP repeat protein [Deltaproteobacteria bacterium]|nr:FG-GAP repeat protein [Deltaproteobacteria bacterium]